MIDLFLKTETEEEMLEALSFAIVDGELMQSTKDFEIDMIGQLTIQQEKKIDDEIIQEAIYADGFHANIRCTEEIAALIPEESIIEVSNPKRVFL